VASNDDIPKLLWFLIRSVFAVGFTAQHTGGKTQIDPHYINYIHVRYIVCVCVVLGMSFAHIKEGCLKNDAFPLAERNEGKLAQAVNGHER